MTEPDNPSEPGASNPEGKPSDSGLSPGSSRFQDPATAVPRQPSLAEQRERERVRREAEAAAWEQARKDAEDAGKRAKRRVQLIGGAVAVGLVGVLAVGYLSATDNNEDQNQSAQCMNDQQVVVDDSYCDSNQGSVGPGGMFLFFVGGNRYQYSYGSNVPVGARSNGSLSPAPGASYATGSGKSVTADGKTGSSVTRGGLGTKSGGAKSSAGGSKSSGS